MKPLGARKSKNFDTWPKATRGRDGQQAERLEKERPMTTDSHFKNELLDGWDPCMDVLRYVSGMPSDSSPVDVLQNLIAPVWASFDLQRAFERDRIRLASLIRARLAGAERAKEVAESCVKNCVGGGGCISCRPMREILEALDGK